MSSSELEEIRSSYYSFNYELSNLIKQSKDALDRISGADIDLSESYIIDNNSADNGLLSNTIGRMRDALQSFNSISSEVESLIVDLDRQIAEALERELAEQMAASAGNTGTL